MERGDANADGREARASEAAYYPSPWVVLSSYAHPAEAHVARQKLESEGIDAYLDNENLVATDFLLSNATGGIKLMVRESDAARAQAVLDTVEERELAIEPAAGAAADDDEYCEESWRCSKCRRKDVELVPLPKVLVLLTLPLLCAPLLLLSRTCRCRACGHEWRQ